MSQFLKSLFKIHATDWGQQLKDKDPYLLPTNIPDDLAPKLPSFVVMGRVALKSWAAGLELRGGVRASSRADSESAASTGGTVPQPPWARSSQRPR